MSDTTRQSMTDKAKSALKPDSQKSTVEQVTDTVKGKADSIASAMQPNSQKSTSQAAGDMCSNSNDNQASLLNKAKNAVGMNDSSCK